MRSGLSASDAGAQLRKRGLTNAVLQCDITALYHTAGGGGHLHRERRSALRSILRSGTAEFPDKGFCVASLRNIAGAAGVTTGAFDFLPYRRKIPRAYQPGTALGFP